MADNFLEKQMAEYERKKKLWLKNKKHIHKKVDINRNIEKPEDETL
ncbi:MAG: dehydrogenase [Prevotella sp.]|nr:dehydrogenase [Prevotella sp.]